MPVRKARLSLMILVASAFASMLGAQGIPKPAEQFASITSDGMWTWYGEPKAVYYEGTHKRTYMVWCTSIGGIKGIGYYDHDTKDTMMLALPKMPYAPDDHNHPSIIMRPDGKILVFCTGHPGGEITELISKNPEDITAWEAPVYPGGKNGNYTYPNAVFLKGEGTKGRFYLFFRDALNEPWFCTSDDWGLTWGTKYHMFSGGSYKPYCKYASDDSAEIHIIVERENREGNSAVKPIYYMKYKNGAFFCANGRQLATMATLPVYDYNMDTIFYANRFGCSNTCYDIAIDKNKNPVTVMDMFKDTSVNIYWYLRWTGTQWFKTPMVNSGLFRGSTAGTSQSGFAAGVTLDHEDPNNVYMCRQLLKPSATPFNLADTSYTNYKNNLKATCWTADAYAHEVEKWTTKDGGATWDTMPITRGTKVSYMNTNCLPCVPRHHKAGMKVELIWLNGIYQGMSPDTPSKSGVKINNLPGYAMSVRMFPFKDGESPTTGSVSSPRSTATVVQHIGVRSNGISLTLVKPASASCKLYSLSGKQTTDLTSAVRSVKTGGAFVPFSAMHCASGAYIAVLDDGVSKTVSPIMVPDK